MQGGGELPVAACNSDIPRVSVLSLTPPTSPMSVKAKVSIGLLDLSDELLVVICGSPRLDPVDRVNVLLSCRRLNKAMAKGWSQLPTLQIANIESDDDRISDKFVRMAIRRCAVSLTSLKLCLSSSINSNLCQSARLFEFVRPCVNLREFTLLLTQLNVKSLNLGLVFLRDLKLRKLVLVNSVANKATMAYIVDNWKLTLRSLGLINCFDIDDDALEQIVEKLTLHTFNIRGSRRISISTVQKAIDAWHLFRPPLKLYLHRTRIDKRLLLWNNHEVWFAAEGRNRKRCSDGSFAANAFRPDWEYDSENDDFYEPHFLSRFEDCPLP